MAYYEGIVTMHARKTMAFFRKIFYNGEHLHGVQLYKLKKRQCSGRKVTTIAARCTGHGDFLYLGHY